MFPCGLYCVQCWLLWSAERGTPKLPKSQKRFPGILGEFLGSSWEMHKLADSVGIFNITAMLVAVVPILPKLVGSWCTWGLRCARPAKNHTRLVVGCLCRNHLCLDLRHCNCCRGCWMCVGAGQGRRCWGLLVDSHAELLDICQLALHCGQAGCLTFDGFLSGCVRGV